MARPSYGVSTSSKGDLYCVVCGRDRFAGKSGRWSSHPSTLLPGFCELEPQIHPSDMRLRHGDAQFYGVNYWLSFQEEGGLIAELLPIELGGTRPHLSHCSAAEPRYLRAHLRQRNIPFI
jgi:hypothetical protein